MAQVEARRVEIGQIVPYFALPSIQGGWISSTDFKQKCNLVRAYQGSILDWLSLIEMECPECGPGDTSFS